MAQKRPSFTDLAELRKAVDGVSAERKEIADGIIAEIVFLTKTLESLKAHITKEGAIIESERGRKENPALRAYNVTIQRYSLLFKQVVDLLPTPALKAPEDPLTEFIKQGQNEPYH